MRMWMVDPKLLCRNHLLGEHFEIHTAVENLHGDGRWTRQLTKSGYLEPQNFEKRHDELVREMELRGYNHKSPLEVDIDVPIGTVDRKKSIRDLKVRCKKCYL